jgi:hypothetical protein
LQFFSFVVTGVVTHGTTMLGHWQARNQKKECNNDQVKFAPRI